jgi:hypothetical protein
VSDVLPLGVLDSARLAARDAEDSLAQVARWLRSFHQAVADFVPPADAVWRIGGEWAPGLTKRGGALRRRPSLVPDTS